MPTYVLDMTEDAKEDLAHYTAFERKVIVDSIGDHLTHQPDVDVGSRKALRNNPIARWELRIGKYRVFYEIDTTNSIVSIISIGHKEHNTLYIRGKETKL